MEDGTHAMIFDVQILENESTDDEAELELSESEKQWCFYFLMDCKFHINHDEY